MSPSGKAPGFGPGISEVRVLPPQPIKSPERDFVVAEGREPPSKAWYRSEDFG